MVETTWQIVLSFLIGLAGALAGSLLLYLIVALSRVTLRTLRGDFDGPRSTRVFRGGEKK